jgi:hypothetical protein
MDFIPATPAVATAVEEAVHAASARRERARPGWRPPIGRGCVQFFERLSIRPSTPCST